MTITLFDTVTVDTVPPNPQAVAGYTSGWWPTYVPLTKRFPNAYHLSIAINAWERARCLDIETGDARPDQAPFWFRNYAIKDHGKPVLYTSASQVQTVVDTMNSAGIPRHEYLVWSAHYTYRPHICGPNTCGYPAADGTQFNDRARNSNLDESVVSDEWFHTNHVVPSIYTVFDTQVEQTPWGKMTEREAAAHYDGAAKHPWRYRTLLPKLKRQCGWFAGRILTVATETQPHQWSPHNRGARYQLLVHRAEGHRLV